MRILAITNLFPHPWQPGRAAFNRQQFKALASRHPMRVIAPIAWTDELFARWNNRDWSRRNRSVVFEGIQVEHPRYMFPPRICRGAYGDCYRQSIGRAFDRALNDFHPDIVYATWAYPDGWAAVKLARQANLPVVVKVHGSDICSLDHHPVRKRKTQEALSEADRVIAVSEDLARRVVNLGIEPDRVDVVGNGVDTDLFFPGPRVEARSRLGLSPDQPIILFVGNLVHVKGIDVLIRACQALRVAKPKFSCYVIGQGPLQAKLERLVQQFDLAGIVKFLGPKPHNELPDWYRAANLVVLPSYSEGLPNVLLEAIACGTRFVASDVGGVRELAMNGQGQVVPPRDEAAMAEAIQSTLSIAAAVVVCSSAKPRSFADSAQEVAGVLERTIASYRMPLPRTSQICSTR